MLAASADARSAVAAAARARLVKLWELPELKDALEGTWGDRDDPAGDSSDHIEGDDRLRLVD